MNDYQIQELMIIKTKTVMYQVANSKTNNKSNRSVYKINFNLNLQPLNDPDVLFILVFQTYLIPNKLN